MKDVSSLPPPSLPLLGSTFQTSILLQAVDPDLLRDDGLDLDIAQQMADISIHETLEPNEPSAAAKMARAFQADTCSSKV